MRFCTSSILGAKVVKNELTPPGQGQHISKVVTCFHLLVYGGFSSDILHGDGFQVVLVKPHQLRLDDYRKVVIKAVGGDRCLHLLGTSEQPDALLSIILESMA